MPGNLVIIPLVFWARMEVQDLLNENDDINNDECDPALVLGPANLLCYGPGRGP